MIAQVAFLALAALGGGEGTRCQMDARGFCTSQVVRYSLSYAQPDPVIRINVALGTAVSIEFPPYVGVVSNPIVGNAAFIEDRTEGRATSADDPLRVILWPKLPPGLSEAERAAFVDRVGKTNIHIKLDGGLNIILEVKVAEPEVSVQRLLFDFPERQQESQYVQEHIAEGRQKVLGEVAAEREKLKEDVKTGAQHTMALGMLTQMHCETLREQGMQDLLIVRATRICRVGEHVFVHFTIKNRARDLFSLGDVAIKPAGDGAALAKPIFEYDMPTPIFLGFDSEVHGVAAFEAEAKSAPRAYTLTVTEEAGKKRALTLGNVSF